MVLYREKEDEKDCVRYSGEEYKKFEIDRLGVHTEYCDDEEDE
jgi:hypothetical protein